MHRNVKRLLALILSLTILAGLLTACGGGAKNDAPETTAQPAKYESIEQMKNVVDGIWMNANSGIYIVVENGSLISYDENTISTQLNKLRNTTLSFDDYCKTFSTDCATKVEYDYTNGDLLNSETQELIFSMYDENSAFGPNNIMYVKDSTYYDWLEKVLLDGYINTRYPNILSNKDVQFDKFGTLGQPFMIEGTAELDDYYNWGYRDYEASHFCIKIRPVGGSYSDEWTIYASRSEFKELFDELMNGSRRIYLIAKTEFADTGSVANMATLVDYFG